MAKGAYPNDPVKVVGFCYKTSLHLKRKLKTVKRGGRKSSNFVVTREYKASARIRYLSGPRKGQTVWFPIKVPPYFITDLSSVPPYGRCLISQVGRHLEASIVHDWLYCAWQHPKPPMKPDDDMRNFADDVFRQAMRRANVSSWRIFIIYWASRACGWSWFVGENELFATCCGEREGDCCEEGNSCEEEDCCECHVTT